MKKHGLTDYLYLEFSHPVRDPVWQNILFPDAFLPILDCADFRKLAGIRQLGPTHLVYPGAMHTRYGHSLGVYHLGKKLIQSLLPKDGDGLLDREGVDSFLCACLLHDLGHFPYAHSLKELSLKDHEELTSERILSGEIRTLIQKNLHIDPQMPAYIVNEHSPCSDPRILFYRKLLSGVLDPDKLDYLNRDAYYCGVSYGTQDLDFVFHNLYPDKTHGLLLDDQALMAVENLLFSKYLMYRSVYWHKTVRSATAMIKKALYSGLSSGAISQESLYGLTDADFERGFSPEVFPDFQLVEKVTARRLFQPREEKAFMQGNLFHRQLCDLSQRAAIEKELGQALFPKGRGISLMIDVPEDIRFEVGVPVRNADGKASPASGSVFTRETVESFVSSIRKIRILADPGLDWTAKQTSILEDWKKQKSF
jgi:HD superfamily phosphohydrolase